MANSARVPEDVEVQRLSDDLSGEFKQVGHDDIEHAVRDSFERHSARARVKDFVPIFVERELRRLFRSSKNGNGTDGPDAHTS